MMTYDCLHNILEQLSKQLLLTFKYSS